MTKEEVIIAFTIARQSEWRFISDQMLILGGLNNMLDEYLNARRSFENETKSMVEAINKNWK